MLLKSLHYWKIFELKRERALKLTFPQYQSVDKMGEPFCKGQSLKVQRYVMYFAIPILLSPFLYPFCHP